MDASGQLSAFHEAPILRHDDQQRNPPLRTWQSHCLTRFGECSFIWLGTPRPKLAFCLKNELIGTSGPDSSEKKSQGS